MRIVPIRDTILQKQVRGDVVEYSVEKMIVLWVSSINVGESIVPGLIVSCLENCLERIG